MPNAVRLDANRLRMDTIIFPPKIIFSVAVVESFKDAVVLQSVHHSHVGLVERLHSASYNIGTRHDKVTEC